MISDAQSLHPHLSGSNTSLGCSWPTFFLLIRLVLFVVFGLAGVVLFSLLRYDQPWLEATRWWPFQVILCNVLVYLLLRYRCSREGTRFYRLWGLDRGKLKHDALVALALVVPSAVIGYFGLYLPQLLLYGPANPPTVFYQPLPIWAALLMIALFPLSNALMETTTYFGYSASRLATLTGHWWLAAGTAGFFLALQHVGFPLLLEPKYILWRFLSFIVFALYVAAIYAKMRRLTSIIPLHFLADMSTAVPILIASFSA